MILTPTFDLVSDNFKPCCICQEPQAVMNTFCWKYPLLQSDTRTVGQAVRDAMEDMRKRSKEWVAIPEPCWRDECQKLWEEHK